MNNNNNNTDHFTEVEIQTKSTKKRKQRQEDRYRNFCFTINNPTFPLIFPDGLPDDVKYLVYQKEQAPTTGTIHFQGYIQFKTVKSMKQLTQISFKNSENQDIFPFARASFKIPDGSAEQNRIYCTKERSRIEGPWELGIVPKGQGKRTDLEQAATTLLNTGNINTIAPSILLKYFSNCVKLASLAAPPFRDEITVITLTGETGIGKTFSIRQLYPNSFVVNMGNCGCWWDGYTNQSVIVFDEFRGQIPLQRFLQLLDPYPTKLEIKGGFVNAYYTLVFITSNSEANEWYEERTGNNRDRTKELAALYRRTDYSTTGRHGIRYISTNNRKDLHQKLDLALSLQTVVPKPSFKIAEHSNLLSFIPPPSVIPDDTLDDVLELPTLLNQNNIATTQPDTLASALQQEKDLSDEENRRLDQHDDEMQELQEAQDELDLDKQASEYFTSSFKLKH